MGRRNRHYAGRGARRHSRTGWARNEERTNPMVEAALAAQRARHAESAAPTEESDEGPRDSHSAAAPEIPGYLYDSRTQRFYRQPRTPAGELASLQLPPQHPQPAVTATRYCLLDALKQRRVTDLTLSPLLRLRVVAANTHVALLSVPWCDGYGRASFHPIFGMLFALADTCALIDTVGTEMRCLNRLYGAPVMSCRWSPLENRALFASFHQDERVSENLFVVSLGMLQEQRQPILVGTFHRPREEGRLREFLFRDMEWSLSGDRVLVCGHQAAYLVHIGGSSVAQRCNLSKGSCISKPRGDDSFLVGRSDGVVVYWDGRDAASGLVVGQTGSFVHHVYLRRDERTFLSKSIDGSVLLFDIRRPLRPLLQINSGGEESQRLSRSFWVPPESETCVVLAGHSPTLSVWSLKEPGQMISEMGGDCGPFNVNHFYYYELCRNWAGNERCEADGNYFSALQCFARSKDGRKYLLRINKRTDTRTDQSIFSMEERF